MSSLLFSSLIPVAGGKHIPLLLTVFPINSLPCGACASNIQVQRYGSEVLRPSLCTFATATHNYSVTLPPKLFSFKTSRATLQQSPGHVSQNPWRDSVNRAM
jgi:hypothetical protein